MQGRRWQYVLVETEVNPQPTNTRIIRREWSAPVEHRSPTHPVISTYYNLIEDDRPFVEINVMVKTSQHQHNNHTSSW